MSVHSIVNYSDFHLGLDFDAEHYHPARLEAFKYLSATSSKRVGDSFAPVSEVGAPGGDVDVYDLTDALGCFLSGDGGRSSASSKKQTQSGDIIVSRLRSYLREICIIPKRGDAYAPYVSTEFIVLRPKCGLSAWLLPFLLSKPVQDILTWSQTGNLHPRIHVSDLLGLPVPSGMEKIKATVSKMVNDAVNLYETSLALYPEAERELMERIFPKGLKRPRKRTCFVKNFDSLRASERIDAEYHDPKHGETEKLLRKSGATRLGDMCLEVKRGVQPRFFTTGDVAVIDSKAVRPQGVDLTTCEFTDSDFFELVPDGKAIVRNGDVLLNSTGLGTLGRATFYHHDKKSIADNHVTIIRVDTSVCLPEYLSLFLNSPIGISQSERFQTGSSGQVELYPEHIRCFLIPTPGTPKGKIDIEWQRRIADMMRKSVSAKDEAKKLLKEAVLAVEKAIGMC